MLKSKLLVVNLKEPHLSQYVDPSSVGTWLWGKSITNWMPFKVKCGMMKRLDWTSGNCDDVQKKFNSIFLT